MDFLDEFKNYFDGFEFRKMNTNENKKKKKKLTKAEKERLKQEEAERRAKEEEEARLRMEEEEKERREKERLEAEERARLEELERIRRNAQLLELNAVYEAMKTTLGLMHEEQIVQRAWERYMRCDGSPDPTVPGQINTYLNVQREENEGLTFDQVLDDSTLILSLIEELKFIIEDSPTNELQPNKSKEFKDTILELEALLQYKLDQGSHQVFRDASILADPETGNLQTSIGGNVITLSCWGNLAKNPRLKNQAFSSPEEGLTFFVPRPLALTDCAVRFLRTEFDHLSHLCQFYYPRVRTTPVVVEEETTTKKTEGKKGTASEPKDGKDHDKDGPSRDPSTMMSSRGGTQTATGMQRPSGTSAGAGATSAAEESEAEEEGRDVITPEPEYIEFEDFGEAEDVVDLRAFEVLGGVVHFDLLHLPPQPKTVKNWTITQIDQPAIIKRMTYSKDWRQGAASAAASGRGSRMSAKSTASPLPQSRQGGRQSNAGQETTSENTTSVSGKAELGDELTKAHSPSVMTQAVSLKEAGSRIGSKIGSQVGSKVTDRVEDETPTIAKKEPNPAFGLTFRIPQDCMFFEPPLIARWDFADKIWKTSDLDEVTYNEEDKTYSFKTFKFGPLACLQDRHLNFPFQGWELRPLSASSALFTINAALVDVEIEIKGDKCCLRKPTDMTQLEGVLGEWIVPRTLIKILRSKGVNIFPNEDSRKYVQNSYKLKWMQEHKQELWGLFLFPEEFDVPEEVEVLPEDDFFDFLIKPDEEPEAETEPEPIKKKKKGKKGKKGRTMSINRSSDPTSGSNQAVRSNDSTVERQSRSIRFQIEEEFDENKNLNKKKKKKKNASEILQPSKGRKSRRKKTKEIPKTPQQIVWESFNEWLNHWCVKHTWIESNLHQQMALCAHVLAFGYSRWNMESGEKRLVLQAAEATQGEQIPQESWGTFLMTSKRVMALKMKEADESFSEDLRDGTEIMSNFYHMAQHIGSEGLSQRLKTVDYSFVKAVKELLDATQVITYA